MISFEQTAPRHGRFGSFGGRFVPELLIPALEELESVAERLIGSESFQREFRHELSEWGGRETPLTEAPRLSKVSSLRVLLKREDLLHGGAHKTNNAVGQALIAKAMGKRRLIAETGAGQHGVATAMAGARLGLQTVVYMGAKDIARQRANVQRMKLCGAEVRSVDEGSATLKDAINEALRDWAASVSDTHYVLGSACGPHPYPSLVRDLQSVIGEEARAQCVAQTGGLPAAYFACVGGGSNAIGSFHAFRDDPVQLIGVEPGGKGLSTGRHGATLACGTPGLLHGARTLVLQDAEGQIEASHSVSAGLDYPAVGPEHAGLQESGRARYVAATDTEALDAFQTLCHQEGIIPAFESAHAIAAVMHAVKREYLSADDLVIVTVSGRGDKDLEAWDRLQEGNQ